MRSARALILLGTVATTVSGLAVVAMIVVLLEHNLHPPHVDADLLVGLLGLILCMAALAGSLSLLLTGMARRSGRPPRMPED